MLIVAAAYIVTASEVIILAMVKTRKMISKISIYQKLGNTIEMSSILMR
jgi:hypothetical protein